MSAPSRAPTTISRPGGGTLSLFATPLNPLILQSLHRQPMRLAELRQAVGGPAQTTLRAYLAALIELGAVAKAPNRAMPYSVSHELTGEGGRLLFVLDVLSAWLSQAPQGPIGLGTEPAKAAIKALTDGWDAAILRSLAEAPRSLTELDNAIPEVSYPSLERRLSTMRVTGLLEAVPANANATPYALTPWARQGIAPLISAVHWERQYLLKELSPVTWIEVETAFLMALPLVELPENASGECVLAVDTKDPDRRIAGVYLTIERGQVINCETTLRAEPPTFALGSPTAWLEAVIAREPARLRSNGDRRLVKALVGELHRALFGTESRTIAA